MKLTACGKKYSVQFHHGTDTNPFWLYEHWNGYNEYGLWTEHKKLIVKYQNMQSILWYLYTDEAFAKDCWK